MHGRRRSAYCLQRDAVVLLPSVHGTTCVDAWGRWEGEMGDRLSCLVCRNNLLVVVVPSPNAYREELPLPVLHHCDHGLLQCHTGRHLDFLHRQGPLCLDPQEQIRHPHCPVFGDYVSLDQNMNSGIVLLRVCRKCCYIYIYCFNSFFDTA